MTRHNPPVSRTAILVYLQAPYAPLDADGKVDVERLAVKGSDATGNSKSIPCTEVCYKRQMGYDENGNKLSVPMHLSALDQVRYMFRIGADGKAFRVDRYVEQDRSLLDRKEERRGIKVRVEDDEAGMLTMTQAPHNIAAEVQRAVLDALSEMDKFSVGMPVAGFVISSIEGNVLFLTEPGSAEAGTSIL